MHNSISFPSHFHLRSFHHIYIFFVHCRLSAVITNTIQYLCVHRGHIDIRMHGDIWTGFAAVVVFRPSLSEFTICFQ